MAFTPFVETDLPSMGNFNEKFLECIAEAVNRSPSIKTGSYVGTGTYGEDNPCSLIFDKKLPQFLFVYKDVILLTTVNYSAYSNVEYFIWSNGIKGISTSILSDTAVNYIMFTEIEKQIKWYGTSPTAQLNISGKTYRYVAIFEGDTL